jgi:hypothetical protein
MKSWILSILNDRIVSKQACGHGEENEYSAACKIHLYSPALVEH